MGKKLLSKHIETLKEKINLENSKSKEFMTNVSFFVEKSILN
jgi:hypothetical protein